MDVFFHVSLILPYLMERSTIHEMVAYSIKFKGIEIFNRMPSS